jgi:streptothricin hydrolase
MVPPTALLVIDAQQGLLDGETAVPHAIAVIDRIKTVLAAARSAGALVVHLQNDGAPGTLDERGMPVGSSIHTWRRN